MVKLRVSNQGAHSFELVLIFSLQFISGIKRKIQSKTRKLASFINYMSHLYGVVALRRTQDNQRLLNLFAY